jgi:hypothetical protein
VGGQRYTYLLDRYWDGTWSDLVRFAFDPRADIVHFAFPGKLMFAAVLAGAVACLWRGGSRRALALLVVPAAITVAAAGLSLYPFGAVRQDMFLLPMIYVCAALGVAAAHAAAAAIAGRWAAAALVAVVVAALAWTGATRSLEFLRRTEAGVEPMRPIVAGLVKRLKPGERIYVYSGAQPAFRYYWRHRREPWIAGSTHMSGLDAAATTVQLEAVIREVRALTKDPAPFWLLISHMDGDDAARLVDALELDAVVGMGTQSFGTALLRVTPRAPAAGITP